MIPQGGRIAPYAGSQAHVLPLLAIHTRRSSKDFGSVWAASGMSSWSLSAMFPTYEKREILLALPCPTSFFSGYQKSQAQQQGVPWASAEPLSAINYPRLP
jgi:hypothetical protein